MKKYITALLIVLVVTVGFSTFQIQPANAVPTSSQLKTAIDNAKSYIDHLYETDGTYHYVKEYPAFPLGIYVQQTGKWFLIGADYKPPISVITTIEQTSTYDHFNILFCDTEGGSYNFELDVHRFYYTDGSTKYRVGFVKYTGAYTIDLYLGDDKIISNITSSTGVTVVEKWKYNFQCYPAHRYTARHGFQLVENVYGIWGSQWYGKYLTNLLADYGFTYDIYDPMFFESVGESDGFMFTTQAYHDVDVYGTLPRGMNPHRYPYWSKVGINRDAYITASFNDPLLRALSGIHILNKYNDPDHTVVWTPDRYWSARSVARWIETNYWNGYGVSVPLKDPQYASGVRSAVFLVLETLLGYKFNDATSKSYADSMADVMVKVQWRSDGYGETADYGVILRTPHAGAFLLSWKTGTSYPYAVAPKGILEEIIDMFAMPHEDAGVVPTNLETTATCMQALRLYLYYRYKVAHPNLNKLTVPPLNSSFEITGRWTEDFETQNFDYWVKADYSTSFTTFKPENVKIYDHYLRITVPPQKNVGGQLDSKKRYGYGTYTAYLKPALMANVLYAYFMYYGWNGYKYNDEIDIEFLPTSATSLRFTTWKAGVKTTSTVNLSFDWSKNFHTYTIVWQSTYVDLYVDGTKLKTHTTNVPTNPMYVLFSGYNPNYYKKAPTASSTMYVDWVILNAYWVDYWDRTDTTNVVLDTTGKGIQGSNSIKIVGGTNQRTLYSMFNKVAYGKTYTFGFYLNIPTYTSGGTEYWVSEFDINGNYLGGQWMGSQYWYYSGYKYFNYSPSSSTIKWVQLHLYTVANSDLVAYIDDVIFVEQ